MDIFEWHCFGFALLNTEHTRCVCLGSVTRRGQKIIRVIKIILKIKRLVCFSWMGAVAVAVVDVIAVVVAIIILSFSAHTIFMSFIREILRPVVWMFEGLVRASFV